MGSFFAVMLANAITYPGDLARRRLIMTSGQSYKYTSFFDCFRSIYKAEGFKGYVRGLPIILPQSVAGSAILFLYDKIFTDLKKRN